LTSGKKEIEPTDNVMSGGASFDTEMQDGAREGAELLTENETLFLSCSIYFYGRITYLVPIAEPHMKLVSECMEMGLQPWICPIPRNYKETPNRTHYDENTNSPTASG